MICNFSLSPKNCPTCTTYGLEALSGVISGCESITSFDALLPRRWQSWGILCEYPGKHCYDLRRVGSRVAYICTAKNIFHTNTTNSLFLIYGIGENIMLIVSFYFRPLPLRSSLLLFHIRLGKLFLLLLLLLLPRLEVLKSQQRLCGLLLLRRIPLPREPKRLRQIPPTAADLL